MKKLFFIFLLISTGAISISGHLPDRKYIQDAGIRKAESHIHINAVQTGQNATTPLSPKKSGYEVIVSDSLQQQMRFGIDNIVMWFWHPSLAKPLAELGVKDIDSDFVRVAINCAYELTEGDKNPDAYNDILDMMTAMRTANPDIKFFGSPLPLWHAYGDPDSVPWTPYPMWIQEWENIGTQEDPQWKKGPFHVDKLVDYFADYLNLMNQHGFDIHYLDLTNEQQILQPHHAKIVADSLPQYLDGGIQMPEFIVPSGWSHQVSIDWLRSVDKDKDEHHAFSIASTHNTGGEYLGEILVNEARELGDKEVWSTELHDWGGVESAEEIRNSDVLWKHIRDGFNGFDTWLFYGNYEGRFHSMIWSHPYKGIRKSTKYEIFKKLVNNTNRGYYLSAPSFASEVYTTSFAKGNFLTLWVLNNTQDTFDSVRFKMEQFTIESNVVEETLWNEFTPRKGTRHILIPGETSFTRTVLPNSLYCFKMKLENPVGGGSGNQPRQTLDSIHMEQALTLDPDGYSEGVFQSTLPALTDSYITGMDNRDLNFIQTPEPGTLISGSDNEVHISISNDAGDTTRLYLIVHVGEDDQIPLITCKKDTTVYVEPGTGYLVNGNELAPAYVYDNTAIASITNSINDSSSLANELISPGTIKIYWTAADVAGNEAVCAFELTVKEGQVSTGTIQGEGISVYPNPTEGKLFYDCPEQTIQLIKVSDLTGKVLIKREFPHKNGIIDLSDYSRGAYILRFTTDMGVYTTKIINR